MSAYSKLYYYGSVVDKWLPEITFLPFVSLPWKLNPTWYRVIGPSGGGKSTHFKAIERYEFD